MRRSFINAAVVAAGVCFATASLAEVPGWVQSRKFGKPSSAQPDKAGLRPAGHVQKLPKRIELRPGQKASYSGVHAAGVTDPSVLRIDVDHGVLTVLAIKPGNTTLMIYGASKKAPDPSAYSNPPQIPVSVQR